MSESPQRKTNKLNVGGRNVVVRAEECRAVFQRDAQAIRVTWYGPGPRGRGERVTGQQVIDASPEYGRNDPAKVLQWDIKETWYVNQPTTNLQHRVSLEVDRDGAARVVHVRPKSQTEEESDDPGPA